MYLVGGADAAGPQPELYWTIPTADGEIPGWSNLPQSDLPFGLVGASPIVTGPNAILVGGATADGPTTSSARANTAPLTPFFQLGVAGTTIPGLHIQGEIGQQLGYLNAAGAGTVGFVILVLIGWAFAHQEQTKRLVRRVFRRWSRSAGATALAVHRRAAGDRESGSFPGVHATGHIGHIRAAATGEIGRDRRGAIPAVTDHQQRPIRG